MWFVTAALAADPIPTPAPEPAEPTAEELRALAREHTTRGVAEVAAGLALTTGGVLALSLGRGDEGAVSREEPWLMDLRSVGGAVLTMGGLTTLVIGGNDVSIGRRLRLESASVTPALVPGGAGAVVSARF